MADPSDSSLEFFTKATPNQWAYVLSCYKDVLKLKAALRKKKGGPEELIRLDNWYQEQLPKEIHSRNDLLITHKELVEVTKWKLMRGKFRPKLIDLVRINTEMAVSRTSKKAFRKLPNLNAAVTALTGLKGVGPATASAILAAAFPEHAPYMADESMLSTPGIETIDYTLSEYLNYAEQIKACSARLGSLDSETKWNPHKVELALWTHYLAKEMKPDLLEDLPSPDTSSTPSRKSEDDGETATTNGGQNTGNGTQEDQEDKSQEKFSDESSQESSKTGDENTGSFEENESHEPPSKKLCV